MRAMRRLPQLMIHAAFATVLGIGHFDASAAEPAECKARLQLKLTPDVPNPRDPGFLATLAGSPLYRLTWIEGDESNAVVLLIGPATDYRCEKQIGQISRNSHIADLKVLPPEP
jgi:hypothetical protein